MNEGKPTDTNGHDLEESWRDLPESIRDGFLEEQAMWEEVLKLEAEIARPRGLLGLFGLRTSTGCY